MSAVPDDGEPVRVQADDAELEGPRGPALAAVMEEGERVEHSWTAADFADSDWEHPDTRPRMRGWLHLIAFFTSIVAGAVLIPLSSALGARAGFSVAVYSVTICGLFGVSALYHRRRWSPRAWKVMKRLDHSMIFVFIAGTYTPFALLSIEQPFGAWLLSGVWTAALAGVALKLVWPTAPRWLGTSIYIGLGWVAVFVLGDILGIGGVPVLVLLGVGGLLYTIGGVAYAARRPNPWPGTFGYHEVFHAMTIVAALCHNIAVYFAMYNSPFVG
jgi:hemolysin III